MGLKTEKWVREHGFVYTGISSHSQDECQVECDKLRAAGFKAYVTPWVKNPLSRSISSGFSVFADDGWFLFREANSISKSINELPATRQYLTDEFNRKMKELNEMENQLNCRLAEIRVKMKQMEVEA